MQLRKRRRINRGPAPNVINPSDLGVNIVTPVKNFIQVSVGSYFSVGCGTCATAFFNANTFQYSDDVDLIRGRHQMAFGVDAIRYQLNFNNEWNRNGVFNFTGSTATGAISTGDRNACRRLIASLLGPDSMKRCWSRAWRN